MVQDRARLVGPGRRQRGKELHGGRWMQFSDIPANLEQYRLGGPPLELVGFGEQDMEGQVGAM